MLQSLHIQNVVLIENLSIDFQSGLCALTGETGAGKSILLDSLGLATGARSEARLVRKGAEQAIVTAAFYVGESKLLDNIFTDNGLSWNAGDILLKRQVGHDGRSRAWINDQPVSIGLLKEIGDMLVEYHGQFETHGLLNPKTHAGLLDDYAGLSDKLDKLSELWRHWREAGKNLADARAKAEAAKAEEDYIRACWEELDKLAPQSGEEEHLDEQRQRLKNKASILEALDSALQAIVSEEGAETTSVHAARTLERLSDKLGEKGDTILAQLDQAVSSIREAAGQIEDLAAELSEPGTSLEEIEDRLYALRALARKHNCLIDDLPQKQEEFFNALDMIDNQDGMLSKLESLEKETRKAYENLADEISVLRAKKGQKLDALVMQELVPLKLERAVFKTSVERLDESGWGPKGKDAIRFLVATNPGSEPGPLNKIASGGEMARFMLALKVILAEVGTASTLVFDEVDTGIGGATADAVGQRLSRLGQYKQLLVVTHSPQVAAAASHHWKVSKQGDAEIKTDISVLEHDERREEIARMLAGAEITAEARAAAVKLLERREAA